jgi:hypothetical protein
MLCRFCKLLFCESTVMIEAGEVQKRGNVNHIEPYYADNPSRHANRDTPCFIPDPAALAERNNLGTFDTFGTKVVQKPSGRLKIMTTSNQDNPKMNIFLSKDRHEDDSVSYRPISGKVVLGLDIWEHAYYLKYRNKREDYIDNFWKVVNWEFVNERLK